MIHRMNKFVICLFVLLLMAGMTLAGSPEGTLAVPSSGMYCGAYVDFGEFEDDVTDKAIDQFEKKVGKKQAIIASSSYWGQKSFPAPNLKLIYQRGSFPLVFWSVWGPPYDQDKKQPKYDLNSIIQGKHDEYIDLWADQAKAFGRPFMVSLCNEMNGTWFPWSGYFYGQGKVIKGESGNTFEGPETFKKAYRHIVDRVRARGASNIIWVFHVNNYSWPQENWNLVQQYYPGSKYVDWLGLSVYAKQYRNEPWADFKSLLEWPYLEVCALDPDKPVMLAEWGVGEFPPKGRKARWVAEAFREMNPAKYPRLKAAVFWHEKWENSDGSWSNLRVDSSPSSLGEFKKGIRQSHWLDRPQFHPTK